MRFDLVTPTRQLASFTASDVRVPGSEGDFGVLEGHQPFLSTLRPGVLEVHRAGEPVLHYVVSQGFVDVTPESVTVLAEEAVEKADINLEATNTRLAEVEAKLAELKKSKGDSASEVDRLLREVSVLEIKRTLASA